MSHNKQRWQLGHSMTVSDIKGSIDDLSVWYQSINYTYRIAIIGVAVCVFCANAMCSKTTVRHFDVQSLTWPSKSPDLNAIEHMWDSLENRIRNCPAQPRTRKELQIALHEEWVHFPQYKIQLFISSMRKRCRACIAVREGHSRYWIVNLMKSNY